MPIEKLIKKIARRKPVRKNSVTLMEPQAPAKLCKYLIEIDIGNMDVPQLSQLEFELDALQDAVRYELKRQRSVMSQIMNTGNRWIR